MKTALDAFNHLNCPPVVQPQERLTEEPLFLTNPDYHYQLASILNHEPDSAIRSLFFFLAIAKTACPVLSLFPLSSLVLCHGGLYLLLQGAIITAVMTGDTSIISSNLTRTSTK